MRRIGRLRSEASPSKVAAIAWLPTTPIISREPVPALPKSSGLARREQRAEPGPVDAPAAGRQPLDRRAERRQASPVRSTSSPSSRPSISSRRRAAARK